MTYFSSSIILYESINKSYLKQEVQNLQDVKVYNKGKKNYKKNSQRQYKISMTEKPDYDMINLNDNKNNTTVEKTTVKYVKYGYDIKYPNDNEKKSTRHKNWKRQK